MSFFKKPLSALGVDIGAGGIKLVELRQAKNRPQLWTYALVDETLDIHVKTAPDKTPEQLRAESKSAPGGGVSMAKAVKKEAPMTDLADPRIEKYARLLKLAAEKAKVTSRRVTASLPVSSVFHAVINMPKVPERELSHHVQAKVSKMLPRPIEEMQVVHQVIPAPPGAEMKYMRLLVTAAPRDMVRFYTTIFQKAGLQLEELETEAFALARSLVGRDPATAMVVDIGAERTNFFIIDQGLPLTHRSIQLGGHLLDRVLEQALGTGAESIAAIKADLSRLPPATLPNNLFIPIVDPVIKEIQYSFDLFLHQTGNEGKRPEKIILTGGSAVFPPLVSLIAGAFPALRVFVGDPWARVVYQQGLKTLLDEVGPRMSVCIGLGLRGTVAK